MTHEQRLEAVWRALDAEDADAAVAAVEALDHDERARLSRQAAALFAMTASVCRACGRVVQPGEPAVGLPGQAVYHAHHSPRLN